MRTVSYTHLDVYKRQVAELFNRVQLAATGADISCTSLGNEPVGLATPVTVRGVTAAYLFANTLVVLEVTREALCAALERCAAYFTPVSYTHLAPPHTLPA